MKLIRTTKPRHPFHFFFQRLNNTTSISLCSALLRIQVKEASRNEALMLGVHSLLLSWMHKQGTLVFQLVYGVSPRASSPLAIPGGLLLTLFPVADNMILVLIAHFILF